jgi:hypothetical protein
VLYGYFSGCRLKYFTYATMIYVWNWIGFIFAATVLFIIMAKNMDAFPPFILLLAGMPTFVSGFILKFRPLIAGGFLFWIFALIAHFASGDISALSVPVAMLTGYIIPGYMIKRKADNDKI